jgi:hypothetical protein
MSAPTAPDRVDRLVALGVAPEWRRGGLAAAMLGALVDEQDRRGRALVALHTAAERDPIDPLPRAVRREVAERLLVRAFHLRSLPPDVAAADPYALLAVHLPDGVAAEVAAMADGWLPRR